jgi:DNA-directed RNA polymerase sigma subunit (sigma70/sigma32)
MSDPCQCLHLRRLLTTLPDLECIVIRRRFGIDSTPMSHHVLGQILGITVDQVRRLEESGLERLRGLYGLSSEGSAA